MTVTYRGVVMLLILQGCSRPVAALLAEDVVGTYRTDASAGREQEMSMKVQRDGSFEVRCALGGDVTVGAWHLEPPFFLDLQARRPVHGKCAEFLPLITSATKVDGRLTFGIGAPEGVRLVKE